MGKLILLFTVVPIVELWLLLSIGGVIGFWPTVALALGTAVVGVALAKYEGLRVLASWRASLAEGRIPDEGLTGGLLVLLGAALLVTPGVLTDVAGLTLLIPPVRRRIAAAVNERLQRGMAAASVPQGFGLGGLGGLGGFGGEGRSGSTFFSVRVVDFGGGRYEQHVGARSRSSASPPSWSRGDVIDVDAEVIDGDERNGPASSARRLPG